MPQPDDEVFVVFTGSDRWFAAAFSTRENADLFRAWCQKQHPRRQVWVESVHLDAVMDSIKEKTDAA